MKSKSTVLLSAAVMLGLGSLVGCAASDINRIGPKRPARAQGCPVEVFPAHPPSYAYVDIAEVKARCRFGGSRSQCIEDLRSKACYLGGDTVYGFSQGMTRDYTMISATVAYRSQQPPTPPSQEE